MAKSVKTSTKEKLIVVSGKRKQTVARATICKGEGTIMINKVPLDIYTPAIAKMRIQEAVLLAEDFAKKVNIRVNVRGGGWSSQAEAVRLSIAKAFVEYTKSVELKKRYLEYDRQLLVADTRYKETRKPGTHSHARSKRQLSFR
jgi:small subunit ribosomal protein S9